MPLRLPSASLLTLGLLLALSAPLAAQPDLPPIQNLPSSVSSAPAYRVGPRDVLQVRVVEVPSLNVTVTVNDDGKIALPLVGEISVQGLTDQAVAARLKQVLESRYVQHATVYVQISEFRSKPITFLGAVGQPGPLASTRRWTLLEALVAAGGVTAENGGTIYVQRRADNGLSAQLAIPVEELMVEVDPKVNIPIYAGDLINIPRAKMITLYLVGEFAGKGELKIKSTERVSVLTVVAKAGLTDRASKTILVRRKDENGEMQEYSVNYKKILKGDADDFPLQDQDILVAKESFF